MPDLAVACTDGAPLRFSFYAFFEPVSYSADPDLDSAGYQIHLGYEADLLTALEAMDGAGLSFERRPVGEWPGNWLLSAGPDFDVSGGGITILESRTRDDDGNGAVRFTNGHIAFRQSLLVSLALATTTATTPCGSPAATSPSASRCWCGPPTRNGWTATAF